MPNNDKKSLDKLIKIIKKVPQYTIKIGVFSGDSKREAKVTVGVTNAELMYIHENGSPTRHLYGYKVLQKTINYANENLLKKALNDSVLAYLKSGKYEDLEKPLRKMCMRMENYARSLILDNEVLQAEHPNSYYTAKAKWLKELGNKGKEYPGLPAGSHPLFDTGQLTRSITCVLERTK